MKIKSLSLSLLCIAPMFQPSTIHAMTINTDSGSATGSTITLDAGYSVDNCGYTVTFTAAGSNIRFNVTDSHSNTIFGKGSGSGGVSSSAVSNTIFGAGAFSDGPSGSSGNAARNCGFGVNALANVQGDHDHCAFGYQALQNVNLGYNGCAFGALALSKSIYGSNCAFGYNALGNIINGTGNCVFGNNAGTAYTNYEVNNIIIGTGVVGTAGESNTLRIGNVSGGGAITKAYITGIYGVTTSGGTSVYVNSNGLLGTTTSSRRFKENIENMGNASEFIHELRPVVFNYKTCDDRSQQTGLIAEEVYEINPSLVALDQDGEPMTVRYENLPAILLNEVQKDHRRISELEQKVAELKQQVALLLKSK